MLYIWVRTNTLEYTVQYIVHIVQYTVQYIVYRLLVELDEGTDVPKSFALVNKFK